MFEDAVDYQFIKEDLLYCRGYAQSVLAIELPYSQPLFDNYAVAATYYCRAAEHALFLSTIGPYSDERVLEARELFIQAAEQYKNWGSPYALLLALVADNRDYMQQLTSIFASYLSDFERYTSKKPAQTVQFIYALMADWGELNLPIGLIREWVEPLRQQRVGILGLSVNQFLNVADALNGNSETSIQETMTPILTAYDEALQLAIRNRYHFRRLLMNFHPINLEVIGLLLRTNRLFSAVSLLERSPISPVAKSFLIQLIRTLTQFN